MLDAVAAFGGVLEVEVFGGFQHLAAHLDDEVAFACSIGNKDLLLETR